ncbi:MAG: glutaredoxin family protein [Aquabacterium sp.]|jgi:glutaredoxin|nr:glutaredoxin family protein [Aquabacterium sp.]
MRGSTVWIRLASALVLALFLALAGPAAALTGAPPPASASATAAGDAAPAVHRTLVVFVREGCPHCAKAKEHLAQLARQRPALRIELRDVDVDFAAAQELSERSRAAGIWPPGVPAFVLGDALMVGFDDGGQAARRLDEWLSGADAVQPHDAVDTPLGLLSASRLGLPLFTLALGLIDGLNPCAMWVLLFLLSMLVRLRDRARMAWIAGTFVAVSGAVYYAFMAAWLNLFLAVGLSDAVRLLLAVLALAIGAFNIKDFIAWGRGPSIGIPQAAKPGIYARMRAVLQARAWSASLLGVAALAVVVNMVELLCTAGIPALFTAVLAQQGLEPAAYYGYLGLYIVGYMADDTAMVVAAVAALGSGRLDERGARVLKLLSGVVMVLLGALLLWRPQWVM